MPSPARCGEIGLYNRRRAVIRKGVHDADLVGDRGVMSRGLIGSVERVFPERERVRHREYARYFQWLRVSGCDHSMQCLDDFD